MQLVDIFRVLSLLCLSWDNSRAKVFPKKLKISERGGFLAHLVHPVGFEKLLQCNVTIEMLGQTVVLDLAAENPEAQVLNGAQIQRYSQSICGIRVTNLTASLAGSWKLQAVDDRLTRDSDSLLVEVLPSTKEPPVKNITVFSDDPRTRIQCPNSYNARHCRLWDPEGVEHDDKCGEDRLVTVNRDVSTWKCRSLHSGEMQETLSEVNVFLERKPEEQKAKVFEDETRVVLTCFDSGSQCRAERPNGGLFLVTEGLLMDRYSAFTTSLSQNDPASQCSLEIEKPLLDEDLGVWRLNLGDTFDKGCVFQLGKTSKSPGSNVDNPKVLEVFKGSLGPSTATIECKVPHEIEYCYLQVPEGAPSSLTSTSPESFRFTKDLGICRFRLKEFFPGSYSCGVNDKNGGEDLQTYYLVRVYDVPAKAEAAHVEGKKGKSTRLQLKSLFNQPISYCRFTTPSGEVHGVSERFSMTGNLRYAGEGLSKGDCGILIEKVDSSHFGLWKCTFRVAESEYSMDFVVSHDTIGIAYVAGPILAAGVIGVIAVGYLTYKKRAAARRERYNRAVENEMDYTSQGSHES